MKAFCPLIICVISIAILNGCTNGKHFGYELRSAVEDKDGYLVDISVDGKSYPVSYDILTDPARGTERKANFIVRVGGNWYKCADLKNCEPKVREIERQRKSDAARHAKALALQNHRGE